MTPPHVEQLVIDHQALVEAAVREASARIPPHIDRDDLRSAALHALLRAAHRYDPTRGIPFHGYAHPRIRGAILDALRLTTSTGKDFRTLNQAQVISLDHKPPNINGTGRAILDYWPDPKPGPEDQLLAAEQAAELHQLINQLRPRQREVIQRVLLDGEPPKTLAAERGITVEAIYQLRTAAVAKLRNMTTNLHP